MSLISRRVFALLTAYFFLLQVGCLPVADAGRSRCPRPRQANAAPVAQKDASQLKCDGLAEAPGEPDNSGSGVRVEDINTAEAHDACYQAANGQAWRARYQFLFGRVLEAESKWPDAAKWYEAAGDNGFADAYVYLGFLYARSQPQNFEQAASWYQKAASQNSAKGSWMLGSLYENGQGVQKNPAEAARLYGFAGNAGLSDAAYRLGLMLEEGGGVQRDPYTAAKWFYEAGQRGHAYAQEELGYLFYTGNGVPRNFRAAFEWFYPAAQAGLPRSQAAVGVEYDIGEVVQKDPGEAVKWYNKAVAQGLPYAMYRLALHYREGLGVPWSEAQAARLLRQAADQGLPQAQASLGFGYMNGLGQSAGQGVQDYGQAVYWLEKAARQGEPHAEFDLGWLYENGWGVEKNLEQARALYLAAAQGDDPHTAQLAAKFANDLAGAGAGSSGKTPGWVAPVLITAGVLALFAAFGGHGSGGSADSGGGYSGGGYGGGSMPDTSFNWGSSTPEVHVPHCHQVAVEHAFSTSNGCELSTPGACAGDSGATTIQCDD